MAEMTRIHPTSRRLLLQGLGLSLAAGAFSACQGPATKGGQTPFMSGKKLPIGLQLYTLGDLVRSDLDGTLTELAAMGYRTVEIPNYMGKSPGQLRTAFDAAGLACTSAHVGLRPGTAAEPGLLGDLDLLAEHMNILGAKYVVAPILSPPTDIKVEPGADGARTLGRIAAAMTEDHWKRLAQQLNDIAAALKPKGLQAGYHNHNIEFVTVGGRTGWDILLAETDPKLVTFEMDVGWTAAAGLDPAALFDRNPGRYRLMHVKDVKPSTVPNFELRMDPTEVGSGRIDWAKVLPAAYRAGVREFFVEQEAPFERSRIEAVRISCDYLSALRL